MATIEPSFEGNPFENFTARVNVNEQGFADIDVTYYAQTLADTMTLLKTGKTCPLIASGMVLTALFKSATADRDESGLFYTVVLHWKGVAPSVLLTDRTIQPNYAPRGESQPIQTHPMFLKFAGSPLARNESTNPQFDADGNFVRFNRWLADGSKNPKAGTENFYSPGLSVSDARVMIAEDVSNMVGLFNVGRIDNPPHTTLPVLKIEVYGLPTADRNYLLTGLDIEDCANGYVVVGREWLLSGPWGWDTDIYEYSDTGEASGD